MRWCLNRTSLLRTFFDVECLKHEASNMHWQHAKQLKKTHLTAKPALCLIRHLASGSETTEEDNESQTVIEINLFPHKPSHLILKRKDGVDVCTIQINIDCIDPCFFASSINGAHYDEETGPCTGMKVSGSISSSCWSIVPCHAFNYLKPVSLIVCLPLFFHFYLRFYRAWDRMLKYLVFCSCFKTKICKNNNNKKSL